MKFIQVSVLAALAISASACSTTKYRAYSSADNLKAAAQGVKGKSPKEAAEVLGKPMSAYFHNGDTSTYHMVYPMSDKDISMADLMFNDRLECLDLIFEKENGYKYQSWGSNTGFTCGAIKSQKLDTSLID
jgi:hypothetical protein